MKNLLFSILLCFMLGTQATMAAEENMPKDEHLINIPARLEHIAITFEKRGQYVITLGFPVGNKPIAELERSFRNDFTGTIEIYRSPGTGYVKYYKTINYEDFSNFAYSQLGDSYGPSYHVDLDFRDRNESTFIFVPHIKARKECSYIFAIHRDKSHDRDKPPIFTRILNYFSTKDSVETNPPTEISPSLATSPQSIEKRDDSTIQARVDIERVDIDIEVEGDYSFNIGFQESEKDRLARSQKYLDTDYKGEIKVYKNGKLYRTSDYIKDSGNFAGASYAGWSYRSLSYLLGNDIDCGVYSFTFQMLAKKKCGFIFMTRRSYSVK